MKMNVNACRSSWCAAIVAVVLVTFSHATGAAEPDRAPLFKIERSKNANIVQYDAQLDEDGVLHHRKPVAAYWVRLAHGGEVKKLSWVQRRFAYGFKARVDREADSAELDMVADIGRSIMVAKHEGEYRATTRMADAECLIETIFVHSSGSGLSTKVNYTEFHGVDVDSGETCYEKLEPG
jgi:hypothetical protein